MIATTTRVKSGVMKPSGLVWAGNIPLHWEVRRIGHVALVGNGSTPGRDEARYWAEPGDGVPWLNSARINDGRIAAAEQWVTDSALRECHLPQVFANSVLVAITGEGQTRGRAALLGIDATISQHLAYVRPLNRIRPSFLWRQLQALYGWLREESSGVGSTRAALTCEFLRGIPITVPSLGEQDAIADFLDRKTAAIDALIVKKEQLLDLLAEKRQALVTQAVTTGLNPGVPMADSGDDALPSIPRGWQLITLRYLLGFGPKNGISPPPATGDGVLSFSISAVRDGKVTVEGNEKHVELDRAAARLYWLERGDILVMRGNGNLSLVGTCGIVETVPDECTYPDILMKIRAGRRVVPEFLVAAINSPYVRGQIEMLAKTSNGTFKISGEEVRTLKVAVPPLDEQQGIVAQVQCELHRLDGIFSRVSDQLDRIREYRQALITAAVTGQLDVAATEAA